MRGHNTPDRDRGTEFTASSLAVAAAMQPTLLRRSQGPDGLDPLEVLVFVEQDPVPLQHQAGDEAVRRASNGDASTPALKEDAGCLHMRRERIQWDKEVLGFQIAKQEAPLPLVTRALKQLLATHSRNRKGSPLLLQPPEAPCAGRRGTAQEADQG